ncbi:MAG: sugar nucleotide-binding protein [Alphaproteobacteria bacterium]|nr:sugar nucleotide-binding protein [Alphaproteobacteria bacterium]
MPISSILGFLTKPKQTSGCLMTLLIIGGSGTLGKALCVESRRRGIAYNGLARSGSEIELDIQDACALAGAVMAVKPTLVINSAAIVDLAVCESDPGGAYAVNARPAAILAHTCREIGAKFVHISTDHFYLGDCDVAHDETASVTLVNEYARSKWAAESFALTLPGTLVVRTNFTGWRGLQNRPTFIEWAVRSLLDRSPLTLFNDFWTSTLDAPSLAKAIFDLSFKDASGIFNVASRTVSTKQDFVAAVACQMGIDLDWTVTGSVSGLTPMRADSLGLNVSKAETALGYNLPTLQQAITSLLSSRPTGYI